MKKKIISNILIIGLMIVLMMPAVSYGVITDVIGDNINPTIDSPDLENKVQTVISYIQMIATFISFSMLACVGIKYTLASANDKADVKSGSIKYLIGAIIIFGSSTLINIIYTVMTGIAGK